MKITIIQILAQVKTTIEVNTVRLDGRPQEAIEHHDEILSWLWRQFNRVDFTEAITVLKLPMPSLSVGDCVYIEQQGYVCSMSGWEKLQVPLDSRPPAPKA